MGECASSGGSIPGALFARHSVDPSWENNSFASGDGMLAGVRRGGDGDTAVGDPRGVEQLANISVEDEEVDDPLEFEHPPSGCDLSVILFNKSFRKLT